MTKRMGQISTSIYKKNATIIIKPVILPSFISKKYIFRPDLDKLLYIYIVYLALNFFKG